MSIHTKGALCAEIDPRGRSPPGAGGEAGMHTVHLPAGRRTGGKPTQSPVRK